MPVKDHFHPPLSELRSWESFHARWAAVIADTLESDLLPPGYFAEVQVHVGRIEIDIAAFDDRPGTDSIGRTGDADSNVATEVWSPPTPALIAPADFPDRLEILIFQTESGPTLVSALELISPRNKDRSESRRAFAMKCATYLNHGVGVVIVDIVTNQRASLQNEMVELLGWRDELQIDGDQLYAISYRPVQTNDAAEIQIWPYKFAVGGELPTLPLPLDKGQCLPLDLEATYETACQRMRLPNGLGH